MRAYPQKMLFFSYFGWKRLQGTSSSFIDEVS